MLCVRIVRVPSVGPPVKIREQWVGCVLPLISEHQVPPDKCHDVASGRRASLGGYSVPGSLAVEILALTDPEAAAFWRSDPGYCHAVEPGYELVFPAEVCEIVTAFPGALPPVGDATPTFRDFLARLFELSLGPTVAGDVEAVQAQFAPVVWEEALQSPLTRPLIIMFAACLVPFLMDRIENARTQAAVDRCSQNGHALLQQICSLAIGMGVPFADNEIDVPLSYTEAFIAAGDLEDAGGGTVRPTAKAQKDSREQHRRQKAKLN